MASPGALPAPLVAIQMNYFENFTNDFDKLGGLYFEVMLM